MFFDLNFVKSNLTGCFDLGLASCLVLVFSALRITIHLSFKLQQAHAQRTQGNQSQDYILVYGFNELMLDTHWEDQQVAPPT